MATEGTSFVCVYICWMPANVFNQRINHVSDLYYHELRTLRLRRLQCEWNNTVDVPKASCWLVIYNTETWFIPVQQRPQIWTSHFTITAITDLDLCFKCVSRTLQLYILSVPNVAVNSKCAVRTTHTVIRVVARKNWVPAQKWRSL